MEKAQKTWGNFVTIVTIIVVGACIAVNVGGVDLSSLGEIFEEKETVVIPTEAPDVGAYETPSPDQIEALTASQKANIRLWLDEMWSVMYYVEGMITHKDYAKYKRSDVGIVPLSMANEYIWKFKSLANSAPCHYGQICLRNLAYLLVDVCDDITKQKQCLDEEKPICAGRFSESAYQSWMLALELFDAYDGIDKGN